MSSTEHHARPKDNIPLREETVPIYDISVRFAGYSIKRVHLEPEGHALPLQRTAKGVEVTVPFLSIHCMVVAELGF